MAPLLAPLRLSVTAVGNTLHEHNGNGTPRTVASTTAFPAAAPTVEEARRFLDEAETRLLGLWIAAERAAWVKSNFITEDTESIAAAALEELIATTADLAAARCPGVAEREKLPFFDRFPVATFPLGRRDGHARQKQQRADPGGPDPGP